MKTRTIPLRFDQPANPVSHQRGKELFAKMKREFVMEAFRDRAKESPPDMAALVEARDEALKQLGVA